MPIKTYSPDMFCVDISQKRGQGIQYYTEDVVSKPEMPDKGSSVLTDAGYSNI
jgi:hypothetical protein